MEALHNWIAPVLIRALDEQLEVTESRGIHVEDDLSNLYIHTDSVELVQFVEVRALSDTPQSISEGNIHSVLTSSYSRGQPAMRFLYLIDKK